METQQQQTITNSDGQPIITLGLVPGSNPPQYGLQLIDPSTGNPVAFLGENTAGQVAASITLNAGGSIEVDDGGSLILKSTTGTQVLFAGTDAIPDGSGRTQQSLIISRDDGSAALAVSDLGSTPGHTHQQALQLFDRNGNAIVADDTVSGYGLSRPHLGTVLMDTNASNWPATTSTSWTTIANQFFDCQHPKLSYYFSVASDSGTAGQFRLLVAGNAVATDVIGSGGYQYWSGTVAYPASVHIGDLPLIELQAMVTSGTGKLYGQSLYVAGASS
ncbi:MAG TPA: hypothetical protein VHO91_02185 [Rhodopila sp.]|nr:hypothetical protein [Rhodopila sp.]